MPSSPSAAATSTPGRLRPTEGSEASETRFQRRLGEILRHATDVFCEKGYEGASMRDLSRATGMSLAGLYHYFGSKERLLYLIQKETFTTIVERLKACLAGVADPEQRIRIFIQNHLEYFVANQSGLKVLAHEDEALKNSFGSEIAVIKREYYRICVGLMDDLKRERRADFNSRTAVMSLFGMINWIYTWYNPRIDGTAKELAEQMSSFILFGVCGAGIPARARANGYVENRDQLQVPRQAARRGSSTINRLSSRGARKRSHSIKVLSSRARGPQQARVRPAEVGALRRRSRG